MARRKTFKSKPKKRLFRISKRPKRSVPLKQFSFPEFSLTISAINLKEAKIKLDKMREEVNK